MYEPSESRRLELLDKALEVMLEGTYEKANPDAMQSFLIDTVINFYECLELKVKEVKIDFSNLREKDENELKPIIESIARYFNLRIV